MTDIFWIFAIILSYIAGRISAPGTIAKGTEHIEAANKTLQDDITYYKKLTNTLVDENKQLRNQVNKYESN
jgi:hypothetical protein